MSPWTKNVELELRKRANVYHSEMYEWMKGIGFWTFMILVIGILGVFVWWMNIGLIAVSIWMLVVINWGLKGKQNNIIENSKAIRELEDAK